MFGAAATLAAPGSGAAADHALEILWRAVVVYLQNSGAPAQGARNLALQIWALSHGVAMLSISGHLDPAKDTDLSLVLEVGVRNFMEAAVVRARSADR